MCFIFFMLMIFLSCIYDNNVNSFNWAITSSTFTSDNIINRTIAQTKFFILNSGLRPEKISRNVYCVSNTPAQ